MSKDKYYKRKDSEEKTLENNISKRGLEKTQLTGISAQMQNLTQTLMK